MALYETNKKIEYSDCDLKGNLSMLKILEIVQDSFSSVTSVINVTNFILDEKYNSMWVFLKTKVNYINLLRWNTNIFIACDLVMSNKLFCYIKTSIYKDKELCCEAISEVAILSKIDGKMQKLDLYGINQIKSDEDYKFRLPKEEYNLSSKFNVSLSMIDFSNHLNNTKTIPVYIDLLGINNYEMIFSKPYKFMIQYSNQAKLNDNLLIEYNNKGYIVKNNEIEIVKMVLEY